MTKYPPVKPPRLPARLLEWYCNNANIEDLQGDLEEIFYDDAKRRSLLSAQWGYWKNVLRLLLSYAIRKRKQQASVHQFSQPNYFNPAMLKNYFIIASRNLMKHKFFTVINILGLAIGMSFSLLFLAILSFLWTYDTFHKNYDQVYRVTSLIHEQNTDREYALTPAILAEKLKTEATGIKNVVRINKSLSGEVLINSKKFRLSGYYADKEFLDVFTFPLIKGNPATALHHPHGILITETAAKKIFAEEESLGKTLDFGALGLFEITGVLKDIPKNSHMQFEVLASYEAFKDFPSDDKNPWHNFTYSYVYFQRDANTPVEVIENYLASLKTKVYHQDETLQADFNLQALADIAPGKDLYFQIGPDWSYPSLILVGVLTLLILLPACFNYANISISRALKRMKEIGLRKTFGGVSNQIFTQFIVETVIITLTALVIGTYLFMLIREEFLKMIVMGNETLDLSIQPITLIVFVLFALFIGFTAGFIPAKYFARLKPVEALKSKSNYQKGSKFSLKKFLMVAQFALSLGFIMSVVIVWEQYREVINYNFGFDQSSILDVQLQGTNPDIAKNEFEKLSAVKSVSFSSGVLGTQLPNIKYISAPENFKRDSTECFSMSVNDQYITNLNLTILAGKNFTNDPKQNTNTILVNEEFVKSNGYTTNNVVGQVIIVGNEEKIIIGVLKNFHYLDLREPIKNFFFEYNPNEFNYANLELAHQDVFASVSDIESTWKMLAPEKPFEAKFFEDEIQDSYSFYFSMIKICSFLGLLAISISCLGMLGMVVFNIENRLKETGVRKVMGADFRHIVYLLSKEFIQLMVIAAFVATPLTYFFFENIFFSIQYYKIPIGAFEIVFSILIMFALGLATVLSQTWRAAKVNPVEILRNE